MGSHLHIRFLLDKGKIGCYGNSIIIEIISLWKTSLIVTCRVKESLGPLLGGISGSLRFGDPVGVAVAERDRPGPIAPIAPGVLWWWCSPDEPICAEEITPALSIGMKQK